MRVIVTRQERSGERTGRRLNEMGHESIGSLVADSHALDIGGSTSTHSGPVAITSMEAVHAMDHFGAALVPQLGDSGKRKESQVCYGSIFGRKRGCHTLSREHTSGCRFRDKAAGARYPVPFAGSMDPFFDPRHETSRDEIMPCVTSVRPYI